LHLWTRLYAHEALPLYGRPFYAGSYMAAVSLLSGRGFAGFVVRPEDGARVEARPVRRFLALQKDDLPDARLQTFLKTAVSTPAPAEASTRVLDVRLAALLWRLFGIRWSVLFAFYAVVSTAACLLVFVIGARVHGYATGLLAAVLFLASPFENAYAAHSLRDLSPLWFDALGLAVLLWATGRRRGPWAEGGAFLAVGVTAALGVGWRTDGFLLPPLVLVLTVTRLALQGRKVRAMAAAAVLVLAGSWATWEGIRALGPVDVRTPQIGFHIAYYGSAIRSNLLGLENGFQTVRDDGQTYYHVAFHADATRGANEIAYASPPYGRASRHLYLAVARYDSYRWLAAFPGFLMRAMEGLGPAGSLQGLTRDDRHRHRVPRLAPLYALLDPLTALLPWLALLGGAAGLTVSRGRFAAGAVIAFALVYAASLLVVLPETKHTGPLLLPLCVLGARGLMFLVDLVRRRVAWPRLEAPGPAVLGTIAVAALSVVALRTLAVRERVAYLEDVRRRAVTATDAAAALRSPWEFRVVATPGSRPDPRGYLLEIEAGPTPGLLVCRHHRGVAQEYSHRAYITRHALHSDRRQFFVLTALQGGAYLDDRTYICTVTVGPGARIVGARHFDLLGWARPLFASVFFDGERSPGSPRVGPGVVVSEFLGRPSKEEGALLMEAPDE
jgi:hypothetical protein